MNNRRAILLASAVTIAAGFIVVLTLRAFAPSPDAPSVAGVDPMPGSGQQSDPAVTAVRQPSAPEAPPPWEQADVTSSVAPPPSATVADPLRERQMRELQEAARGLVDEALARQDRTQVHLLKAMDSLEQMNDPAVNAQVNLPALRHNMELSIRMQAVAKDLQRLSAQPRGPEQQRLLDEKIAEMGRLHSQMRTDMGAAAALPALPAMPALPVAPTAPDPATTP